MTNATPLIVVSGIGILISSCFLLSAPAEEEKDSAQDSSWTKRVVEELDRDYWAFRPLRSTLPPTLDADQWSRTEIDKFIAAQHRKAGIHGNPVSEKWRLLRRAYLDLTGIPPTVEELDAFLGDTRSDAYSRVIDKLLASSRFGERWARHWLDVARFGESEGGEHDYSRKHAYHFRDFVIKAFNEDMPFDQFAKWQIAGDEYAPEDSLAMTATGFLSAGTFPTQLTEREFEQARSDQVDDMASTTATAFLALTVGCARCHDHKFDPIPSADYYRFASAFTRTIRSEIDLAMGSPSELAKFKEERQHRIAKASSKLAAFEKTELPPLFEEFVKEGKVITSPWSVLDIAKHKTANGTVMEKQADGSLLAAKNWSNQETFTVTAKVGGMLTGIRIEALSHPSFPRGGPGLAGNGNFVLTDIAVQFRPGDKATASSQVKLVDPRFTHQQNTGTLSAAASLDEDKNLSGWAVDAGGIGKDQAVAFAFEKPFDAAKEGELAITLRCHHSNPRHVIGRPRISVTGADIKTVALTEKAQTVPADVSATLALLRAGRKVSDSDSSRAEKWFASTLPGWAKLHSALVSEQARSPEGAKQKAQVSSEGLPKVNHHADGRGYPHFYPETHFLDRGDPAQKQGVAKPGYIQVLMRKGKKEEHWQDLPPDGWRTSYRRRSLANWMTDTEFGAGHLFARTIINRLWHYHFGQGLVATPNDFGKQASPPSHPELLDWLASKLIEGGWRLKPIHKLIMTSTAYMQSSDYDNTRGSVDPDNKWLWRRPLRRLEAEALRDSILAISGQLDETMYGPGQTNPAMKRRSIYFHLRRSQIPAALQLFDFPEPLVSQGQRPATTIAPQALLFMNNPQIRESALALARRLPTTGEAAPAIRQAFRMALGREPTQDELQDNAQFVESQLESYQKQKNGKPRETAMADFCQVLFALNEFIYVE